VPVVAILGIADFPFSAVFTSIDRGVNDPLAINGCEPEPVLMGDPAPPIIWSKRRPRFSTCLGVQERAPPRFPASCDFAIAGRAPFEGCGGNAEGCERGSDSSRCERNRRMRAQLRLASQEFQSAVANHARSPFPTIDTSASRAPQSATSADHARDLAAFGPSGEGHGAGGSPTSKSAHEWRPCQRARGPHRLLNAIGPRLCWRTAARPYP
jgi:hypothetical protein